jgi:hypothetical protein
LYRVVVAGEKLAELCCAFCDLIFIAILHRICSMPSSFSFFSFSALLFICADMPYG